MAITAFDTHGVAQILSGAGFTEDQVNAQVGVLTEVTSELVTKNDLKAELSALRAELRTELLLHKKDLIIQVGIMQFTVAVLMLTVIKFIIV